MATFSKQFFSSSTGIFYGLPIGIMGSASFPSAPEFGTKIHTIPSGSTEIDEVWLYATNVSNTNRNMAIQFGYTGSTYEIIQEIPARSGLTLLIPGLVAGKTGSASDERTIAAYLDGSSYSNDVTVMGYVNRISGST